MLNIHKYALVREPGDNFRGCISSHPLKHSVDVSLARQQHHRYCKVLVDIGLEVIHLPRDEQHPDSCFIEDNAIIHGRKALISRMGAESRRGEEIAVEELLQDYLDIKRTKSPATIDGGDVIHLPDHLISGLSQRTNMEGIKQAERWLEVEVETITDPNMIHLKSHVTYLSNDVMIATKRIAKHPVLENYTILFIPEKESYAANTLTINNTVLMANGYPQSKEIVSEAGFEVISLDMSEFQKCEGALTCLSLLF
ncbi:MAG: dimethylarginine dimethylaminohydrolase family protein [Candidatus Hodarchaeales archaeon]